MSKKPGNKITELSPRSSYYSDTDRFSLVILGQEDGNRPKLRLLWLGAWIIIGLLLPYEARGLEMSRDMGLMLFVFMCFWGYYLFKILRAVRWHQVGKEMLLMKGGVLVHKNSIGEVGRSKKYDLSNVLPMRMKESTTGFAAVFEDSFWGTGIGCIELMAEGRTLLIGKRLNSQEAQKVMQLFNKELSLRKAENSISA